MDLGSRALSVFSTSINTVAHIVFLHPLQYTTLYNTPLESIIHTPTYLPCTHVAVADRIQTGLYVIYTICCNGSFRHTNHPFHTRANHLFTVLLQSRFCRSRSYLTLPIVFCI